MYAGSVLTRICRCHLNRKPSVFGRRLRLNPLRARVIMQSSVAAGIEGVSRGWPEDCKAHEEGLGLGDDEYIALKGDTCRAEEAN